MKRHPTLTRRKAQLNGQRSLLSMPHFVIHSVTRRLRVGSKNRDVIDHYFQQVCTSSFRIAGELQGDPKFKPGQFVLDRVGTVSRHVT